MFQKKMGSDFNFLANPIGRLLSITIILLYESMSTTFGVIPILSADVFLLKLLEYLEVICI
jgi:hypothetical protein